VIIAYNGSFTAPEIDTTRKKLYEPPYMAYPTVVFDGTDVLFEPNQSAYGTSFNQHIIAAKSVTPFLNLSLTANATVNTGNLQMKIITADTIPSDSILAFIAICEDSVSGYAKDFNYVVRQLQAFPVALTYPDSLDTIINFTHSIPVDKMTGVLFVQNMNTKKVLQAIKSKF